MLLELHLLSKKLFPCFLQPCLKLFVLRLCHRVHFFQHSYLLLPPVGGGFSLSSCYSDYTVLPGGFPQIPAFFSEGHIIPHSGASYYHLVHRAGRIFFLTKETAVLCERTAVVLPENFHAAERHFIFRFLIFQFQIPGFP